MDWPICPISEARLTLKVPEKLQLYGLYMYYVVHICDFGMLKVNDIFSSTCANTYQLQRNLSASDVPGL